MTRFGRVRSAGFWPAIGHRTWSIHLITGLHPPARLWWRLPGTTR